MMNAGKTVFSQIMDYLPMYEFRKCVNRYNGNYHTSSFTCMDQFLCMAFAQLTYRESLRDIEVCLRSRMDRGYLDFDRLYGFTQLLSFFVTRAKKNTKFRRLYSHPVDRNTGIIFDQTITLVTYQSQKDYPAKLRRIKYFDSERAKYLVFLTNNFLLPALTIADLYKCRWQVELFFI